MKDRLQPILATLASGGTWIVDAHEILSLLVTILTLAWWLRLWLKNPNIKPPPNHEEPGPKSPKLGA
jgi:hypothetical protein